MLVVDDEGKIFDDRRAKSSDRRKEARRKEQKDFVGPEKRVEERRKGDRRK